jgi:hypothetical protein
MAFCRFMLRGEIQLPEHFQSFDSETEKKTRKAYSEHLFFRKLQNMPKLPFQKT